MTEPGNQFTINRRAIQLAAFQRLRFIQALNEPTYVISEKKNSNRAETLKQIIIEGIPNSSVVSNSFIVNLESEKNVFAKPSGFKTVEEAILIFSQFSLKVILIEMKSKLKPTDLLDIELKIRDSISRLTVFFNHFNFGDDFTEYPINYLATIFYYEADDTFGNENQRLIKGDLLKIFSGKSGTIDQYDDVGIGHHVDVHFIDTGKNESCKFNLEMILGGDGHIFSHKTLPLEI